MDIISAPDTKLVIVLSVGFSDHTETSLVLDPGAGDSWNEDEATGDIIIHIAPKPEKRIVDTKRPNHPPIIIAASLQRTITWYLLHMKWFEFNTAQAAAYRAYQPHA